MHAIPEPGSFGQNPSTVLCSAPFTLTGKNGGIVAVRSGDANHNLFFPSARTTQVALFDDPCRKGATLRGAIGLLDYVWDRRARLSRFDGSLAVCASRLADQEQNIHLALLE